LVNVFETNVCSQNSVGNKFLLPNVFRQITVSIMPIGKMPVGQMLVGKMSVGQIAVGHMSVGQYLLTTVFCSNACQTDVCWKIVLQPNICNQMPVT
jgi:hypothetical protein